MVSCPEPRADRASMPTVTCPSCGSVDELRGRRSADGVVVECGDCGHSWQRDLTPTCTVCGSTDLEAVPTATLEEAGRGEQRTPSGIRDVYRCYGCGARDATSSSPVVDPAGRDGAPTGVRRPRVQDDADADVPDRRAVTRRVDSAFGPFAPGETIGERWELQELVRWSTTGSLWRARAAGADREVLFKLVHPRLTADPRRTALHASAAHAVTAIRHPHVLPVLDVKVRDGQVLVVAEMIPGSVLTAISRPDPAPLRRLGADLADGLAALHEQDVTHLDIRPDKILKDDEGRAHLIDFGSGRARAALRTRGASDDERLTFRAPEQVLTHQGGPAADVYSLGLVLWTMAGGTLQRMGPNAAAQASFRLTNDVPALAPDTTQLPGHLSEALAAATHRRPDDRPNATELAELLRG